MYIQRQNDAYKPTNKCGRVLKITEVTQFFIKGMLSSYSSFWFVTRLETWWMEIAAYLNRLLLPSLFFNPKTHKPFVITS